MGLTDVDIPLADITVETAAGEAARIGELVRRPTVLVIPRYYGCLPCRGYLQEVSEHLDAIDAAGGAALAVSAGAAHQARWLAEKQGIRFPLLVDPERKLHTALDLPRRWWVVANPKGWWNYVRAAFRGNRQGWIVEPTQLPGLALLDSNATAVRVHRGRALGDYPPLSDVIRELGRLAGGGRDSSE